MNRTLKIVLIVIVVAILAFFLFFKKSNAPVVDKNVQTPTKTTTTTKPKVNGVQVEVGAKMETGTP